MAIGLEDEVVIRIIGDDAAATRLVVSEALPTGKIARMTLAELQALVAGGARSYGLFKIAADQTTDIDAGDHVEFDTVVAKTADITLSTGAGQADGLITLPAGKIWRIRAAISAGFNDAGGAVRMQVHDGTSFISTIGSHVPMSSTLLQGFVDESQAIVDTTGGAETIEYRILAEFALTIVFGATGDSYISVEEV